MIDERVRRPDTDPSRNLRQSLSSPHWRTFDLPAGGQWFSRGWSGEGSDASAVGGFGEPVAVTLGDDDVGVVEESVDGRGREGFRRDRTHES